LADLRLQSKRKNSKPYWLQLKKSENRQALGGSKLLLLLV
jgi:hypothetical protein